MKQPVDLAHSRVLLTGATGFLGSHLARRLLASRATVYALVRPGSNLSRLPASIDVLEARPGNWPELARLIAEAAPEVVFHLASAKAAVPLDGDPEGLIEANIALGTRLCQAVAGTEGAVLVNAGSYWEYGPHGEYAPRTLYAATKRAMRDIIEHYALTRGLRAVTLVLFDIYGPGDQRPKFIPMAITALSTGRFLPATAGAQMLDLVHVDDAVTGLLHAAGLARDMAEPGQAVYALDTNNRQSLESIGRIIEGLTGRPGGIRWGEVAYPETQIFDPVAGLQRLPGWQAQIGLEHGLRQIVEEIREGTVGEARQQSVKTNP